MRGKKPKERQRYVLRVNENLVEVTRDVYLAWYQSRRKERYQQEALKYLSEEEMELIRLLFFEEYTVKKTAQYFGCCTKTIRNRKNKVLQKLKDRLETL